MAAPILEGSLMQTLYHRRQPRLSDEDLSRITIWVGLMSAVAFSFGCAAGLWGIMAAEAAV